MEPVVIRRSETPVQGPRGNVLYQRSWEAAEPQRALVVVHGLDEHSGRYEHFGSWFAARGFAVHAYDHQGHGRSDGVRCHVSRFDDLLDDLEHVLGRVRTAAPGLPLVLLGHSMGGLVVASLAAQRQPDVSAFVLSAAPLRMPRGIPRHRIVATRLLRRVAPRMSVPSGVPPEALSRDPEVVRAYVADPMVTGRMTVSLAAELFGAISRLEGGGSSVRAPVLLQHGEQDRICPSDASRAFFEEIGHRGSALRTYPELKHEIYNEPEKQTVFGDLLAWVEQVVPTAAREQPAARTG